MNDSAIPPAIVPLYMMQSINQPILLYEGALDVHDENGSWSGTGVIEQQWLPEPTILLDCRYNGTTAPEKPQAQVQLPDFTNRFKVVLRSMGITVTGDNAYVHIEGTPDAMTWGACEDLSKLAFHVPNFLWYGGSRVRDPDNDETRAARAVLSAKGWTITIDSVADYALTRQHDLERATGNCITHIGIIQRTDALPFSIINGREILECLYWWLSFCRGSWIAPILAVGFDGTGKAVWKDWKQWNFRRCEDVRTWVNRNNAKSLEDSFAGLYAKYRSSTWTETVRLAISWYVESNRRRSGMETSIILAQAGLELLAWTVLVEDGKMISQSGFNDLPASDKIRLLLSRCGIPLELPSELTALKALAKEYNWSDGPECLVGFRNAVVHPQAKNRQKVGKASSVAIFEIWSLGLWYLGLILLRLFDYTGLYLNRLKRDCYYSDAVEPVPWWKQDA